MAQGFRPHLRAGVTTLRASATGHPIADASAATRGSPRAYVGKDVPGRVPNDRVTHARSSAGQRGCPARRSGSRRHVGGEDVVGVPVEVLPRPVVAHGGARIGVRAAICTSLRSTPASSMVVTKVCRSMCGCIRGSRTPATRARCRSRRWRRAGPSDSLGCCAGSARRCGRRRRGRWPARPRVAAARARSWCPCRPPAAPGGRVLRRGRR